MSNLDDSMKTIVAIAASAGGFAPLVRIIAALPVPCPAAVFVVLHIGGHNSDLPQLLSSHGGNPATFAVDGDIIEAGHIYVAPPDQHMLVGPACIRLTVGDKVHYTRPAADPLFVSAARTFGKNVVGIVLSGGGSDGARGLMTIRANGGKTLVQLPEDAETTGMPCAAIALGQPDACLPVQGLIEMVNEFLCQRSATFKQS